MDRLDALKLLVRVAERGSFTAAAKDLHIKQSTASKWMAELEQQLGLTLVERTTRSLRLTDAGRRVQGRAVGLLSAYDALVEDVAERREELLGSVRVSVPVVYGRRYLAPLIGRFLARHPAVSVELVFGDRYVHLVEEGFDLAIRIGVPVESTERGRTLAEGPRRLVASPRYLAARGTPKHPKELEKHDCLVHTTEASKVVWRFTGPDGQLRLATVRGRATTNNSEAALELARQGLGIALLADWLVDDELRRGKLVPLLTGYTPPSAPVMALTPPGHRAPAHVRALVDHLAHGLRAT